MAKKTIEFEQVEYTEAKFIEKIAKEKAAYLRSGDEMLTGLQRFHDLWQGNKETFRTHPKIFKAYHEAVQELANTYLSSGHLQETYDNDMQARVRQQVTSMRDTVKNQYEAATSAELNTARTFATKTAPAIRAAHAKTEKPEAPAGEPTFIINIKVYKGGQVVIGGTGANWAADVGETESPADISAQGPKRRSGRTRGTP